MRERKDNPTDNDAEAVDTTVMHEGIFPIDERVIVHFDNGRKTGISDVRQGAARRRMRAELFERKIGRNRRDSPELCGLHASDGGVKFCESVGVPAHSETMDIDPRSLYIVYAT